jgi:transposase
MGYTGGLTDGQWALVEPLLPDRTPRRGGRWRDHRPIVDAVAYKYASNSPWREVPDHFGPWQTVFYRYTVWARDGTWYRMLATLRSHAHTAHDLEWLVRLDATLVATRRHAALTGQIGPERGAGAAKVHAEPGG